MGITIKGYPLAVAKIEFIYKNEIYKINFERLDQVSINAKPNVHPDDLDWFVGAKPQMITTLTITGVTVETTPVMVGIIEKTL